MCTAIKVDGKKHLFGRTLDVESSYGEKIIITKRNYKFKFTDGVSLPTHYAMLGIGCVADNYPLYFDAANEKGLAIAALNFRANAVYHAEDKRKYNVASFEFIPRILSWCGSVSEAKELISKINITKNSFSHDMPPSPLHFMISDKDESITVESVREGIKIYENPLGVLTNNPPFDCQLSNVSSYMYLDSRQPRNNIAPEVNIEHISRGMGAFGMPGDFSSQSRFVRALFVKNHIEVNVKDGEISKFFHVMDSVTVPYGCVLNDGGERTYTVYTSCADMESITYYFTTYESRQIRAVNLFEKGIDGDSLLAFDIKSSEPIFFI